MRFNPGRNRWLICLLVPAAALTMSSCDSKQALSALNGALSTLLANKTLTEQFVRDVKTSVDPAEPEYVKTMGDYDAAKAAYDESLNLMKMLVLTDHSGDRGGLEGECQKAEDAAAEFLAGATRSLRPNLDTKRVQFNKGVTLPRDLVDNLKKLSPKQRDNLLTNFQPQVKWKSWRDI